MRERSKARGRFLHRAPGSDEAVSITRPNKYAGLPITLERPTVLKLHGALDRGVDRDDSYVITEDSYIEYLSGRDLGSLLPIALWQRMTSTGFLFLGYALRDWNLRVILNRIWQTQELTTRSWAVQREPTDPNVTGISGLGTVPQALQALGGTASNPGALGDPATSRGYRRREVRSHEIRDIDVGAAM